MDIKKKFLDKTDILPTLYMDMVFVESTRPILFTCVDKDKRLYICSNCFSSSEKIVWLIAETSSEDVISLLHNECEIQEMFIRNEQIAMVTKTSENKVPKVYMYSVRDISEVYLPTKGFFMDVEENEFAEEINELSSLLGSPSL